MDRDTELKAFVQGLFCSRGLSCSRGLFCLYLLLFCSYLLLFCSPGTILFTQFKPILVGTILFTGDYPVHVNRIVTCEQDHKSPVNRIVAMNTVCIWLV